MREWSEPQVPARPLIRCSCERHLSSRRCSCSFIPPFPTPGHYSHLGLDTGRGDERFTPVLVPSALTTKYANSSRTLLVVLLSSHTASPWFSHFYIFNITLRVNSGSERRALPLVIISPLSHCACAAYCLPLSLTWGSDTVGFYNYSVDRLQRTAPDVSVSVILGPLSDDRYTRSIFRDW